MDSLGDNFLVDFATILTPFMLMSSCATLVWGIQNRYSRVVQSIRALSEERRSSRRSDEHFVLGRQIEILRRRARWLRNGVFGHYLAMGCFLITSILLSLTLFTSWVPAAAVVIAFFTGLVLVCWTVGNTIFDTMKSFDAVGEELKERVLARVVYRGHAGVES
ncbi:MAG: DUF2721 domain-containing protein [Opitutaceae bacterium]